MVGQQKTGMAIRPDAVANRPIPQRITWTLITIILFEFTEFGQISDTNHQPANSVTNRVPFLAIEKYQ